MKKNFSFKIKSVQEYCYAFSCQLKTGLSNFNLTDTLIRVLKPRFASWYQHLVLPMAFMGILMTGYTTVYAQNIKGIAPVATPLLGDGIDGDGWAHEPTPGLYANIGDLFDRLYYMQPPPAVPDPMNHGVLDFTTGNLLYPGFTFFLQDPYNSDPTIFTSSNKINDDPSTYTWGAGSSPNKNEIQNCGAHFSYGSASVIGGVSVDGINFVDGTSRAGKTTDLWCLFAGDRQVTNGSSYIDFEFLQKPLTITGATFGDFDPTKGIAPITGGSGGFTSAGTDGGRTVGDILITIEFTQGGGEANVVIRVWSPKAGGGFEYVVVPNDTFPGNILCTNNNVTTTVPFDVYGSGPTGGTYVPNQWAEGAINLTEVFKNTGPNDPCFNISTLFIRTRTSGNSAQSELKDFPGAPIQLNLNLVPIAVAGADFTKTCTMNPDGKEIGEAPEAGFTYSWSPTTGLSDPTIANPIANPTVTTTYTVTKTKNGTECSDTDDVVVTVNKPEVVAVAGTDFTKTCTANTSGGTIGESPQEGFTYSWTSVPVGFTSSSANPMVNPDMTTTYTVTKTHTASGCSDTDEVTVTVNKPTVEAAAGADFTKTCVMNINGKQIGEASAAGYSYSWSPTTGLDNPNISNPTANPNSTTTYTVTKTHIASGCSDTDDVVVTVNKPTVVAVAGDDFTKTCTANPNGKQIGEASQAGFTYSWSPTTGLSNPNISNPTANPDATTTYTVTKTDTASGCNDTDDVVVTVDKPTVLAAAGADFTKTCITNPNGKQIGEASAAGYSYSWSPTTGLDNPNISNPTANPNSTTTYTVTKTHIASGCSDTDDVVVTVNKPTVVAVAGDDFTKTCTANPNGKQIGEASQAGFTYSWSPTTGLSNPNISNPTANPDATTTYTVTKTDTASGCSDTDDIVVTVDKPTVLAAAGADFTKTCITNPNGKQIGEASASGYSYSWSPTTGLDNPNISNPTANPSVTTTYTVTKTHIATGCSDTDDVVVTVDKPTILAVAGDDFTKTCTANPNGKQIGEAPQAGFTYSWSPTTGLSDPNIANPTANPSVTTTYTVTKTQISTGCSDTDDIVVTVNKPTVVAEAGADFTKTCTMNPNGKQIGEASVAGYSYSWSPTTGLDNPNISNPTANPNSTTTYTVTKTHIASGCSDTDDVVVTVDKPTVVAVAGDDFTKTCTANPNGKQIGEASQAGFTYSWSPTTGLSDPNIANPTANPDATTTYTVTKTHTASGCSDTDEVVVTVNKPTVEAAAGADFTKTCVMNINGKQIGEASAAGYSYSWSPTTGLDNPNISNPTANPSATTTYTVTKTHIASGCSDTDDVVVTVNKPTVVAVAGDDFTKTCVMNINGKQIGEASQAGFTYSWSPTTGLSDPNIANPTANPSVTTTYTVTKTDTASGCSDTDEVTVTVNVALPTPFTLHNLEVCAPLPLNLRSAILEALPDPLVESVTFWTDPQAMNDQITGNSITNYTASIGVHTIYIRLTFVATGCTRIQQFSIDVKSCSAALCTYTQGYYGNPGGMSCAEGQQYTTAGLIAKALASYGGTMTVGMSPNSVWMTAPDDIDDIIRVMPGGGPSKVLSGDIQISSNQFNKYLKNGKINNALLAQTIALGLNIGINGALGNLELKAGTFAVAEPEGGCGSDIPKTRQCSPGGYTPVINEYKYYSIPTKVIDALTTKTVQGLYALANQALGGGSTNGLTLSEIANAVDLINNAFDQCRIFVGYGIEPLVCATPPLEESLISTETSRIADTNTFTASPVPFKDQLTVSYNFDFVTDVRIEVFNTNGYVVAKNYDTNGYLNKSVVLNIPGTGQEEVYVIKLTTNKGSSTQKVISSR